MERGASSQWDERNQRGLGVHQPVRWEKTVEVEGWEQMGAGASVGKRVPSAIGVSRTRRGENPAGEPSSLENSAIVADFSNLSL